MILSIASTPLLSITLTFLKSITTSFGSFLTSKLSRKLLALPKKSGPSKIYIFLLPSILVLYVTFACFHAKTSAEIITPLITAIARSVKIVTIVVNIKTKASSFGILFSLSILAHSNVAILTINIIPISTARGTIEINFDKNTT